MENTIKSSQLTRVRLKVDPAFCNGGEIQKYQGYEGYIIAEDGDQVRVYLECGGECTGMVVTVPSSMIDMEQGLSPLEKLKITALRTLLQSQKITREHALVQMIVSANSPEALESFLSEAGLTERDLLSIYKQAYLS